MEQYQVNEISETNDITDVNADNRIEEWEQRIQEADSSGLTRLQWCEANGISPRRFYYWQKKIREAQDADAVDPDHPSSKVGTFCELDLPSIMSGGENGMTATGVSDALILECGPFRLQIPQAFLVEVMKHA